MNNFQALNILEACSNNTRAASERIISEHHFPETELSTIRSKLRELKEIRRTFVRNYDLHTWEELHFYDVSKGLASKKRKSSASLDIPMQQLVFEGDISKEIRTSLINLYIKHVRTRLQSVLSHIKSIAEVEGVTTKTIASLCLQLIANEDKDTGTIEVCKEIVLKGFYRKHNAILFERNSSFLLDFLSIGKQKYRELRRFLKEEQVFISSYNKVAKFRQETCLVNELGYFDKGFGTPVGIYHSYRSIATQTISQIIEAE